jgi:glycosyltransferase involved in cell wall biosynthesis
VVHDETGLVVGRPEDLQAVVGALASLLDDPDRRAAMGAAARSRAEATFTYDLLALRLHEALRRLG